MSGRRPFALKLALQAQHSTDTTITDKLPAVRAMSRQPSAQFLLKSARSIITGAVVGCWLW